MLANVFESSAMTNEVHSKGWIEKRLGSGTSILHLIWNQFCYSKYTTWSYHKC